MASIQDYISSGASTAAIAYKNAVNQSQDAVNALFRSYGWAMPGANGYSVESAQSAFDPTKLFDINTGGLDADKVKAMAGTMGYGSKGILADIERGGAGSEADVAMELRGAGLTRGGLAAQRRGLAETMTARQMAGAKSEFLTGLAGAYAPLGTAYQDVQAEKIAADADAALDDADANSTPNYEEPPAGTPEAVTAQTPWWLSLKPGEGSANHNQLVPVASRGNYTIKAIKPVKGAPANPTPGMAYKGERGVLWVYRNNPTPGWYKKGR